MTSQQIRLKSTPVENEIDVHVLPCHISYTGPSKVSEFFKVRQNPETHPTTSFRGRKLCGHTVSLPANYAGTYCSYMF